MDVRHNRTALIALLLFALALRVTWALLQRNHLDPKLGDQREYLELGRNLLAGEGLSFYDDRFGQTVYAYRTPGYPAFVAVFGGNFTAIRIAQAVVDTSTVLAIYLIARRFFSARASVVAGVIVAINPFLVYFTGLILSETLFTSMLAWSLYLILAPRRGLAGVAGLAVLAVAVLVRPSALGLVVLLPVAAAWSQGWPAIARSAAHAAILVICALLPWAYRNARHPQVNHWVWTTTNNGITTYDGFHDGATGASNQKVFVDELKPLLIRMDEVERDAYLSQQTHAWIRLHPRQSLRLMILKVARTWSPIPLSTEYGSNKLYVAAGLIYTLPLYVLILLGLWKAGVPRPAKVFLLIPAIYFTVIHALSVGSLRYRIPVEPPMAVIAAGGLVHLSSKLHGPSRRQS